MLRALVADGYVKLGLVVADGEQPTILELFTGGRPGRYAVMRHANAYDAELGMRKTLIEIYERDIGPRKR